MQVWWWTFNTFFFCLLNSFQIEILWFRQYSMNTNFLGFRYLVDPQNKVFIEVQFLWIFCINRVIGHKFRYHWNCDFHRRKFIPMNTNKTTVTYRAVGHKTVLNFIYNFMYTQVINKALNLHIYATILINLSQKLMKLSK